MGSLCVPLSYLSEDSAVHCGACLHHRACGCPPSEAIGCERGGGLCLKWGKAGGGGRVGVSNLRSVIDVINLGHNCDVIGHPEAHQPNLGLLCECCCECVQCSFDGGQRCSLMGSNKKQHHVKALPTKSIGRIITGLFQCCCCRTHKNS